MENYLGKFNKLLDIYIFICYYIYIPRNNTLHTRQHGGKNMDIKSYADILRFAINLQIADIEEDGKGTFATEYMEGYYEGMKRGLEIALQKIDASNFLMEK